MRNDLNSMNLSVFKVIRSTNVKFWI